MTAQAVRPRLGGPAIYGVGLGCGALLALATPFAVLLAALLLPSALARVADDLPQRTRTRCTLLLGVAASFHPACHLWQGPAGMPEAIAMAADPGALLLAWSAQAGGWLLAEALPMLMRLILELQAGTRMRALHSARARLAEEWGLPPRGD